MNDTLTTGHRHPAARKIAHTAEVSGPGPLTVAKLHAALEGLPHDAEVRVTIIQAQREGTYYTVTTRWATSREDTDR